jgi:hypothetical protein
LYGDGVKLEGEECRFEEDETPPPSLLPPGLEFRRIVAGIGFSSATAIIDVVEWRLSRPPPLTPTPVAEDGKRLLKEDVGLVIAELSANLLR